MAKSENSTICVELIDDDRTLTLVELCQSCAVDADFVKALVDEGILEPMGQGDHSWSFTSTSMRRIRITLHLRDHLRVNLAGAGVALQLMEQIEALEGRLRRLGHEAGG